MTRRQFDISIVRWPEKARHCWRAFVVGLCGGLLAWLSELRY